MLCLQVETLMNSLCFEYPPSACWRAFQDTNAEPKILLSPASASAGPSNVIPTLGSAPWRRNFLGIPREQGQGFSERALQKSSGCEFGTDLRCATCAVSQLIIPIAVCGALRDVAIAVSWEALDHFLLHDLLMSKQFPNALDPG